MGVGGLAGGTLDMGGRPTLRAKHQTNIRFGAGVCGLGGRSQLSCGSWSLPSGAAGLQPLAHLDAS